MESLPQVDEAGFKQAVSQGCAMVYFMAHWCESCKTMAPLVASTAQQFAGALTSVQVDFEEQMQVAVDQGVLAFPTTVFYKEGQEISRLSGVHHQTRLLQALEALGLTVPTSG